MGVISIGALPQELYFQEVNEQAKLEMLPQLCRLMHCLPGGLPEPVYRQLHPVLSLVVRTLRGLSGQSARLQCTLFETMAYLTGACASSWVQPQKLTSDMVSLTLAFLTSVSIPDLLNPEVCGSKLEHRCLLNSDPHDFFSHFMEGTHTYTHSLSLPLSFAAAPHW